MAKNMPGENFTEIYLLDFERNFDPHPSSDWMKRNWGYSILLSAVYVLFVYGAEKAMTRRKALKLDWALTSWNLLLAIFSALGVIRMSPEFFYVLRNRGLQHSVCITSYAYGASGFWTQLFAFSKVLELIDTIFIVFRKRAIMFLHVYHHVTVLVYTWHAYKDQTAAGRWFVWMNYLVHSVMYTYFAARSFGLKTPKWVSIGITSLQLSQMIVGCLIACSAYRVKSSGDPCQQTFENLYFSFFIYFTYFLLFAKFFYEAYVRRSPKFHRHTDSRDEKAMKKFD